MNCEKRRELILLNSLGVLDDFEREEIRAHLATGCPVCAGYLAEAEEVLSHLPLALDPGGHED